VRLDRGLEERFDCETEVLVLVRTLWGVPSTGSQSMTLPSSDADARSWSLGENDKDVTYAQWPRRVNFRVDVSRFQSLMVESQDPDAMTRLSGEKATVPTGAPWSFKTCRHGFQSRSGTDDLSIQVGIWSTKCPLMKLFLGQNTRAE
jgi:hypothetical protein